MERRLLSDMRWRQNHTPVSLFHVAWAAMCAVAAVSASACDDEAASPSTLDGAQILAIQATPRTLTPGATHTLVAIGHRLDDLTLSWQACVLPWTGDGDGLHCAAEGVVPAPFDVPIPLGEGNPLSLFVPPMEAPPCAVDLDCGPFGTCLQGGCQLSWWVRVDDERPDGALTAVVRMSTGEAIDNPEITGLETDVPGVALPDTVDAHAELVVTPAVSDPLGEGGQLVSFYTTGGAFSPWRARAGEPSTLTAPGTPGEVTLTLIVRDPGGGVGWATHTMTVMEGP